MFDHFWEKETEHEWGRAEREEDAESEAGSGLPAVGTEPDAGLEPTKREITTWAEVGGLTDWATQASQDSYAYLKEWKLSIFSFIHYLILSYNNFLVHFFFFFKCLFWGAPGWLSRLSVRLQLRSRSHGLWVRAPRRALDWWLRAWSLLLILCLPLSLTLPVHAVSVSKINKC